MINSPSVILTLTLALSAAGCSSGSSPGTAVTGTTWVGTITTEGNVTTVINESGSVWGGTARLVEEASIGVESGPEEYMFGAVGGIHISDDRIWVADNQVPVLRVYDHDGVFITNVGREGEGPGEYGSPAPVTVDSSGRLFILDPERINVYTDDGEPLDTWPLAVRPHCCNTPIFAGGPDELWIPIRGRIEDPNDPRVFRIGVQSVGPEGPRGPVTWIPDIEFDRPTYDALFSPAPTPFAPQLVENAAPAGALLYGVSDRYRFELLRADGTRLVVERYWDPVRVSGEQKEWERRRVIAFQREFNDPEFSWNGASMPDNKPAFTWIGAALSGETWVQRSAASERNHDCAEDPIEVGYRDAVGNSCWPSSYITDVFGADGRYLGDVNVPPGIRGRVGLDMVVDGRMVVTRVEDEAGTIMVKRYRLVLPGEEGS